MLHASIKCLNHNLDKEILITFSGSEICQGFTVEMHDFVRISEIIITSTDSPKNHSKKYIILKSDHILNFTPGDILLFRPNGVIRTIFSINSQDNVLFLTEQCNNHCLMCSQPPRLRGDIDYYYSLNESLIQLLPKETEKLGITGGEPTLLENRLISLLSQLSEKFFSIDIQLLSNGRAFSKLEYVEKISKINLSSLLFGIPIHSDYYKDHDYVAGSESAYFETLKGLYNLARFNQKIELRIVINRKNYKRLSKLSEFIFRNLPFVEHIAFMAIEYTGFVPKNHNQIWVDPLEYRYELESAVLDLATWGMNVSIYNLPFCLMSPTLHKFAKKSISDWKVRYFKECIGCYLKEECGGDFKTSIKHSVNIRAINK